MNLSQDVYGGMTEMGEIGRMVLTPMEMLCIADILDLDMLIGISDPFIGWLVEDINIALNNARSSLLRKGIIKENRDGNYLVEVLPAGVVALLANPQMTCLVDSRRYGEEESAYIFHISSRLSVEYSFPIKATEEISIIIRRDSEAIQKVKQIMVPKNMKESRTLNISIPLADFWEILNTSKVEEGGINNTKSSKKIDKKVLDEHYEILRACSVLNILLIVKLVDNAWILKGIAFLCTKEHLFKIEPNFENEDIDLSVETLDSKKAEESVVALIDVIRSRDTEEPKLNSSQ